MAGLDPPLLWAAAAASKLPSRVPPGRGGRGEFAVTRGFVKEVLEALGEDDADSGGVVQAAARLAGVGGGEARFLAEMLARHPAARLEYPRAACPCCGGLGCLKVKRLARAVVLTE
jgi:hypothetical protein